MSLDVRRERQTICCLGLCGRMSLGQTGRGDCGPGAAPSATEGVTLDHGRSYLRLFLGEGPPRQRLSVRLRGRGELPYLFQV